MHEGGMQEPASSSTGFPFCLCAVLSIDILSRVLNAAFPLWMHRRGCKPPHQILHRPDWAGSMPLLVKEKILECLTGSNSVLCRPVWIMLFTRKVRCRIFTVVLFACRSALWVWVFFLDIMSFHVEGIGNLGFRHCESIDHLLACTFTSCLKCDMMLRCRALAAYIGTWIYNHVRKNSELFIFTSWYTLYCVWKSPESASHWCSAWFGFWWNRFLVTDIRREQVMLISYYTAGSH